MELSQGHLYDRFGLGFWCSPKAWRYCWFAAHWRRGGFRSDRAHVRESVECGGGTRLGLPCHFIVQRRSAYTTFGYQMAPNSTTSTRKTETCGNDLFILFRHSPMYTMTHINMSPAPGGMNSSLSGSPLRPLCVPLPKRGGNRLSGPGLGTMGSNRAPGGAPIGGRYPSPPHGPLTSFDLFPLGPNIGCSGPTNMPSP